MYSEVPIIRPPMLLAKSCLNIGHVSLTGPICIENCILVLKQVKVTSFVKAAVSSSAVQSPFDTNFPSGLNSKGGLNFEWSS